MDIDSNNPSLNEIEEVEEVENNSSLNEIGEVEEPKKRICFSSKQEHFAMNKRIFTLVKRRLEINDEVGIWVVRNFHSIVVEVGGYEALTLDERDVRNHIVNTRRLRLEVEDAESVALYFHTIQQQNSNLYSVIDLDEDGRMQNLFWANVRGRATYKAFGDVVSFDTTYLTNKYDMLITPFVGINYHGQSILLGYELLYNENTETFVWHSENG
ncbi:protein FAR-RED IMPAIRED RESPONSE 1-like [Camellia sinensis]|uniref:protein FAR-RED IMPAIRED RESPONSE 1-like n=1 Tax=Camellia sinensis TaxID=4442 RepID=UPI001036D32F|nr:protein FAR-RED IMPAIRED RESPONSE 1-like [Camellia sinensis]